MKRYRLKYELPTFKQGELFHTDENGNLWRDKGQKGNHWKDEVMAYNHKTIERFPDILTDWFEEYEERDPLAKEAFIEYLRANPEQRLMQAVCNFANKKLNQNVARLTADLQGSTTPFDTWNWECDQMMLRKAGSEAKEPEYTTCLIDTKDPDSARRMELNQMKNPLREWAEKNDVTRAEVYFGRYYNTGVEFVRFRKKEDFYTRIEIKGWPRAGLKECEDYSIEYLLDKANKE
jgi:hypothetical protein